MINGSKIGFKSTFSLVVGNIIGVGIFTTTGYVAKFLDSGILVLLLWILGGCYALAGSVVYGTLVKKYPYSGGDFQYLQSEIKPVFGYLFGWSSFTITYTGSIAALSIGAAHYFNSGFNINVVNGEFYKFNFYDWQLNFTDEKLIAIILVIFFSWINFRGIKISSNYQIILTFLIITFLFIFSIAGFFSVREIQNNFNFSSDAFSIGNFLTAFIAVIFTFIGWTSAVYIAEEIEKPKQTIPNSLIFGVVVVIILYILINNLYLMVLPLAEARNTIEIAKLTAVNLWGNQISFYVSIFIFIAILSTINSTILSGSRIYMSMSRKGYLFGKFSDLHQKYKTPHKAIFIQAIWTIILITSGSFNQLLSFVVFIIMIFSALAAFVSLKIYFRDRIKNTFILVCSILYLIICIFVSINTFFSQTIESLIGLLLILVSYIFYLIEKKRLDFKLIKN